MEHKEFIEWKTNILKAVKEISDLQKQKLSWTGQLSGTVSSFMEEVNTLYDYEFEDFIDYVKHNNLMEKVIIEKMTCLNDFLGNYDPKTNGAEEILNDPRWINITHKALEITNLWNKE